MAFRVEPGVLGKGKRANAGDADLAAVGVAGKDEIDERAAGVGGDAVGEVGLVGHEEDGSAGVCGDGEVEIGEAAGKVVDAGEEDEVAAALDGDVLVDEEGEAVGFHVVADDAGAYDDVVIAEDTVAEGAGEGAEELRRSGRRRRRRRRRKEGRGRRSRR